MSCEPKRIRLVVFDMAGTTIRDDDAVNTCLREALAASITVSRADVNKVMGLPKPIAIRELLEAKGAGSGGAELVDAIHEDFLARMVHFYRTAPNVEPMPHAVETFQELREAGLSLVLDTGFSRPIVDAILTRLSWDDNALLDATVASNEVPRGPSAGTTPRAIDSQAAARSGTRMRHDTPSTER